MQHVFDFHLLGSAGRHDCDLLNSMVPKCSAGAFDSSQGTNSEEQQIYRF